MDLSSRWDRSAILSLLLLLVAALIGCQAFQRGSGQGGSGQGGGLTMTAASVDFGTVVVGSNKQLTDMLKNSTTATVTIAAATATDSSFKVTAPALPVTVGSGQSVLFTIVFTPQSAGKPAGKIAIKSDLATASEVDVTVSGSGVAAGKLNLSPASLSFGSVAVGQSASKNATLTNSGSTNVVISQDSANSSAFTISGLSLPATITPGQTANLTVAFAPNATGAVSGTVTLNGSASLSMNAASGSANPQTTSISATLPVSGSGAGAAQLTASPNSLAFGNVTVGTQQNATVTVTNAGNTGETITQASASGTGPRLFGYKPGQSSGRRV